MRWTFCLFGCPPCIVNQCRSSARSRSEHPGWSSMLRSKRSCSECPAFSIASCSSFVIGLAKMLQIERPFLSTSFSLVPATSLNEKGANSGPRNFPCVVTSTTIDPISLMHTRLPSTSARNAPPPRGNRLSMFGVLVGWHVTRMVGPPGKSMNVRSMRAWLPSATLSFSSLPV